MASDLCDGTKLAPTLAVPCGRNRAVKLHIWGRGVHFHHATSILHPKMEPPDPTLHASSSFPINPAEFDADDRISYSKLDNKFLLVQEDGTEFEFDEAIKRWIPVVDEALLEEQQRAYAVQGVDENEPVEAQRKKRKKEYLNGEDVGHGFNCSVLLELVWIVTDEAPGERTSGESSQESESTSCAAAEYCSVCHRPTPRCDRGRSCRSLLAQMRRHRGRDRQRKATY